MEEIIGYENQVAPDYGDLLEPGYRFNPTDSEIIVFYLKAKIESRRLPRCRLHEVNIYNHTPEELSERYRASEKKWYFLTPRDRMYSGGSRPKRATRDFGYWKATQKRKEVFNDANGQMVLVGHRASLEFHDHNSNKTAWLMHEYTTLGTNLPLGTEKLNEWVLCKIYKKEGKQTAASVNANKVARPSPAKRSKTNKSGVQVQETTNLQMVAPVESQPSVNVSHTSPYPIPMQHMATFQELNSMQPEPFYNQNQFPLNKSNSFTFHRNSDGASSSSSSYCMEVRPPPQPLNYTDTFHGHQFTNGGLSYSVAPAPAPAQPLGHDGYTAVFATTPVNQCMVVPDQNAAPPSVRNDQFSFDDDAFLDDISIDVMQNILLDFPDPFGIS